MAALGFMFLKGEGVDQDLLLGFKWIKRAALKGKTDAQYELGLIYKEGRGVAQDSERAAEWLGKACKGGMSEACLN